MMQKVQLSLTAKLEYNGITVGIFICLSGTAFSSICGKNTSKDEQLCGLFNPNFFLQKIAHDNCYV